MQITSGPKDVMFQPEDVSGMDESWEEHAMRNMYLWECTLRCSRR